MTTTSTIIVPAVFSLITATAIHAAPLRVDLTLNQQRSDILTDGWENWALIDGGPSAERTFGEVKVQIRVANGGELAGVWWKGGLQHGATVASDGVIVNSARATMELVLSGLAPGRQFSSQPARALHRPQLESRGRLRCQPATDVKDAHDSPHAPWPAYTSAEPPADSDHDGMPDSWEQQAGLNPNDAVDGNADRDGDGYTNLEEYLGWLCGEFAEPKS